ncbi:hypothetical protein LOD99_12299 [Oopsacas minuta]|uniref:Chromatin target of PRMT1 protein C-terminal domain-containing protein n=1 Tax=Oopsacas minuta TaxID=111878 RepID=A0AAV7JEU9_9METZ|nr:hypothetical protein LOD99_12299 [Oopsacas minuta]
MDSKIVLKSSTKVSLSDRFAKIQSRASQQQQSPAGFGNRRNIGGSSSYNNPLSVSIKRGAIGSRKQVTTDTSSRLRSGGNMRGGSLASRLQKRPVRNTIQNYVTQATRPVRGGATGVRGFQRGGGRRGGATTRGGGQMNTRSSQGVPGNTPTRGKRTQVAAPKKEDLDKDLESYMSKTKGFLDEQLDDYHKQK